mgnify:CR=1 FL=1
MGVNTGKRGRPKKIINLNTYTIYDNLDDGFTVVYQYYNFSSQKFIKKKIVCKSKSFMLEFTKN